MIFTENQHKKIIRIVNAIGKKMMVKGAQGYIESNPPQTVFESAIAHAAKYTKNAKKSPAIELMVVVLASHRNYVRQVAPYAERLRKNYPGLTIEELAKLLNTKFTTPEKLKEMWGHLDKNKYNILRALVNEIRAMNMSSNTIKSDFKVMKKWADSMSVENWKLNSIAQIPGVGIATFQHLLMTFGVNTIKPDQRVKEVLQREFAEFNLSTTNRNAILAVEKIAEITKYSMLQIDQIFVKYGSGHYQSAPKTKNRPIVKK